MCLEEVRKSAGLWARMVNLVHLRLPQSWSDHDVQVVTGIVTQVDEPVMIKALGSGS